MSGSDFLKERRDFQEEGTFRSYQRRFEASTTSLASLKLASLQLASLPHKRPEAPWKSL